MAACWILPSALYETWRLSALIAKLRTKVCIIDKGKRTEDYKSKWYVQ